MPERLHSMEKLRLVVRAGPPGWLRVGARLRWEQMLWDLEAQNGFHRYNPLSSTSIERGGYPAWRTVMRYWVMTRTERDYTEDELLAPLPLPRDWFDSCRWFLPLEYQEGFYGDVVEARQAMRLQQHSRFAVDLATVLQLAYLIVPHIWNCILDWRRTSGQR